MTDITENVLLDSASIQQCEKLAGNADLQGKRAKALLEINSGENNRVAAEKSGLTAGQVSYLFGRFKKIGMALFNAKVVKKAAPKKATQTISKADATDTKPTPVVEELVIADDVDKQLTSEPATAGDKKKKKKGKKSSKKDKAKKDSKKNKKDKKGKKKKSKKDKK